MVHPTGVEPARPPPEGGALSTELRVHITAMRAVNLRKKISRESVVGDFNKLSTFLSQKGEKILQKESYLRL